MQKFTRALTREVEVAGERLAITFDANGLSIRPVGSRREPHAISWADVACAAAGRARGAVSDALADLRAGAARPRPATPPEAHAAAAAPAPCPLADVLPRLDAWLARHRPGYHAALNPPATPEQLRDLEAALGRPLPHEVATWLSWHNGQKEGFHGAFVEAFFLLPAEQIAATARARPSSGDAWSVTWVPLLASDQGDLIVLDTAAPGRPVREVWQGNDAHDTAAPSLAQWAQAFLADLEANRYVEDPERGELLRVSAG